MNKLDLHGKRHSEVGQMVEDWVITQYNKGYRDLEIITGNSDKMKKVVSEALERAGFEYRVGDYLGFNKGYIQVL